jgi:uncharacterized membrane protein YcaP (DUF421 family)
MMRIMGKRRIGELEADELVSTFLISELGAMPISDSSIPLINAIVPIVFICALEVLLSALKTRWHAAKHVLEGEPTYIIYKGRILEQALGSSRISLNEVLAEMRSQGIGNIGDVEYGVLEANGKLSLIEKSEDKKMGHAIVIDGEIRQGELVAIGHDELWLQEILDARAVGLKEILLLSVTDSDEVQIIKKEKGK